MRLLSSISLSSLSAILCSITVSASDIISLKNGDTLTGNITDSDQAGVFFLEYPESKEKLKIKEDSITNIAFTHEQNDTGTNLEKILLMNGDHFPCKLVSLDDDRVTFTSDYMGKHSVPRNMVQRIYFNNKAQNVIYEGPGKDLSAWTTTTNDWKIKGNGLTTEKKTKIAKTIAKLPENFVFEFNLEWTGDAPRLKVYFCSESTDIGKKLDTYYLDMSSLEFRITHYLKRRFKPLGFHHVNPKIFTVPKGKVSLYVNRKGKKIVLYYNNKKIKEFNDIAKPPKGSGIIFHTLQRTGEGVTISDIKISTWNGDIIQNLDEDTERLKNNDIITDTNGNPMRGKLSGFTKKNDKFFIDFNIAFAKEPSSIPMREIHHIDFQRPAAIEDLKPSSRTLTIGIGGILSYDRSQVVDNKFVIEHPIIGEIKIDKSSISRLELNVIK